MRTIGLLGTTVAAATSAMLAMTTVSIAAVSQPLATSQSGSCVIEDRKARPQGDAERLPAGYYDYQAWLANERAQSAKEPVDKRIAEKKGEGKKGDPYGTLASGIIGVAIDDNNEQLVVVVDPKIIEPEPLQAELRGAAAAEHARNPAAPEIGVRTQAGCHSVDELSKAAAVIKDRSWHPKAINASYGVHLNAYTTVFDLRFRTQDVEVGTALAEELGPLVNVTYDEVGAELHDGNRESDSEPHWGGAGIGVNNDSLGNNCSSGFAVNTVSDGIAYVTAAHCATFGTETTPRNNLVLESGQTYFGTSSRISGYPSYDMALLNAPTEDYEDNLYYHPIGALGSSTDVDGKRNAAVGDLVCLSGHSTLTRCNLQVETLDGQLCREGTTQCTDLMIEYATGGTACNEGDSGGAVFMPPTNNRIVGMHIGESGGFCKAEKIFHIEDHLNVTVASAG